MKQLFTFITLFITLGSTVGLPAPESKEVQVKDINLETDFAEFDDNNLHEVERRAVSRCKILFFYNLVHLFHTTLFVFCRFLSDEVVHYGIHFWLTIFRV